MDEKSKTDLSQIERRHLTVLECDLVGSTTLAHKLDPEELRDLVIAYQDCVLSWINKLDGYFVQFAGDAIWVYFGYPVAHEDDPIRAIQLGLEISSALGGIKLHGETLAARVGIASGLCVVGKLRHSSKSTWKEAGDYITAIGDPPNLAARLQSIVAPGGVAVADETRSLAGNIFEFEDLGFHKLKGFADKTRVWRALCQSDEQSRYRALRSGSKSPLIGRINELETIKRLWDEVHRNSGQVVYLSGDPGIGKSRLVTSVAEEIVGTNVPQMWLHCNEQLKDSAFASVITLLRSQLRVKMDDELSFELMKREYPDICDEDLYLIADLLSIEPGFELKTKQSPSRRRERLNEILIEIFEAASRKSPLLVVVEDLQWIDPSTLALLQRLVIRSSNLQLLILITSRVINNTDESFFELYHVNSFRIEQLHHADSLTLINTLWEGEEPPASVVNEIVRRTDGVPLFIEDVVLSIQPYNEVTSYSGVPNYISIPTKLSDHLMSRIDRLSDSKQIVQIAAVIGREFTLAMMKSLTDIADEKLDGKLERLCDDGILVSTATIDDPAYLFRHAMIRDAAYNSLLISRRKELHHLIARWLIKERPAICLSQPETIAYHYKHAEEYALAIKYWIEAGERSKSQSNYVEASTYLINARLLINKIKPSVRRDRIELDIITSLGAAQAGSAGVSWENTGQIYNEALFLCRKLDYPDEIFPVLAGAGSFHFIRSDYQKSRQIAAQSKRLAKLKNITTGHVIGDRIIGAVKFVTGEFESSINSLTTAIDTYDKDPEFHRNYNFAYALDHKTTALCYLALVNATIGKLDDALDASKKSIEHSKNIDRHSTNCALCYHAALLHLGNSQPDEIVNVADSSLVLATKECYVSWQGMSRLLKGEALIRLECTREGILEIEQGVLQHSELGAQTFLPLAQAILAKGYMAVDKYDKALEILLGAEKLSIETHQMWYLPEIQRLCANVLIQLKEYKAAENIYFRAWNLANDKGALSWRREIQESVNKNQKYLSTKILEYFC